MKTNCITYIHIKQKVNYSHIVSLIILATRPEAESELEYSMHTQNRNLVLVQNIYII